MQNQPRKIHAPVAVLDLVRRKLPVAMQWVQTRSQSSSLRSQIARPWRQGAFTICTEKPEFSGRNSNGTAHSDGKFSKQMENLKRIPLFPFQPK